MTENPTILKNAKVIWTDYRGGLTRRRGLIKEFNADMHTHYVHLEVGGIAAAVAEELEFIVEAEEISQIDLQRVATALDKCSTLLHNPLRADNRARIFTAVEVASHQAWVDARGCYVRGNYTLWAAVRDQHGLHGDESSTPTREQIITALEMAAGVHES